MAMRDITELMNSYRECSRNLWNVYFSKRKDIGDALDVFDDITLEFVDYFDFYNIPIKDFRCCLCRILSFPSHAAYEGREALVEAMSAIFFTTSLPKGGQIP